MVDVGSGDKPLGLRERKKQRTRWAIQEHALRLFAAKGYDATTIEQIAEAAEISPSTFFRYFKTKEDLVIEDEYDQLVAEALRTAPEWLSPAATVRYAMRVVASGLSSEDIGRFRERIALSFQVGALRARVLENLDKDVELVATALAGRVGRDQKDLELRAFCWAAIGIVIAVLEAWLAEDGPSDIFAMVDASLAALEDGFTALSRDSAAGPPRRQDAGQDDAGQVRG